MGRQKGKESIREMGGRNIFFIAGGVNQRKVISVGAPGGKRSSQRAWEVYGELLLRRRGEEGESNKGCGPEWCYQGVGESCRGMPDREKYTVSKKKGEKKSWPVSEWKGCCDRGAEGERTDGGDGSFRMNH